MAESGLTQRPPRRLGSDGDVRSSLELRSDSRLVRRAGAGDERAFAAIFRRYEQDLYRFSLAILGNPEDAQDALQNTMVSALRALPGESRRIELKPWLYRIAHNESIDLMRRRRAGEPLDPELIAAGPGVAQEAEARERLGRLLADLGTLPARQRAALVLRELSGLGFEQIGDAIGSSAAVARQTVYEARLSLRQIEMGREMDCDVVTRALSDADGRVLRRRDIRAHLRACADCRAFRDGIDSRSRTLAALAPLPALAAAGLLKGALGGAAGAGAAGGAAGGVAGGIGGSLVLKAAVTVAVVGVIGVGADRARVVDLGISGGGQGAAGEQRQTESNAGTTGAAVPGGGSGGAPAGAVGPAGGAPTPVPRAKQRPGVAAAALARPARGGQGAAPPASAASPSPAGADRGNGRAPAYGHSGSAPAAAKGRRRAAEHKAAPAHGAGGGRPEPPAKPTKPARPESPGKTKQAGSVPAAPAGSPPNRAGARGQATPGEASNGKSAEAPGRQK